MTLAGESLSSRRNTGPRRRVKDEQGIGRFHLTKPLLYLFRGKTVWMLSFRGIPEDEDLTMSGEAASPTIVPTAVPRAVDGETAFRPVPVQHPTAEVRILNWHRPKRDV